MSPRRSHGLFSAIPAPSFGRVLPRYSDGARQANGIRRARWPLFCSIWIEKWVRFFVFANRQAPIRPAWQRRRAACVGNVLRFRSSFGFVRSSSSRKYSGGVHPSDAIRRWRWLCFVRLDRQSGFVFSPFANWRALIRPSLSAFEARAAASRRSCWSRGSLCGGPGARFKD